MQRVNAGIDLTFVREHVYEVDMELLCADLGKLVVGVEILLLATERDMFFVEELLDHKKLDLWGVCFR